MKKPIEELEERAIEVLTPKPKRGLTFKQRFWNKTPWWRNLWFGDWKIALIFFLAIFSSWAYHHDTQAYREVYENPCAYCVANTCQPGQTVTYACIDSDNTMTGTGQQWQQLGINSHATS